MEEKVSPIDQELVFLIAKYLEKGPFHEAAKCLTNTAEEKKLLPKRYDWEGETHNQSYEDAVKNYPDLDSTVLPKICQRLGPLLDRELKPNHPGLKSLLSGGSQSLLRSDRSLIKSQYNAYEYCMRRHGTSPLVPNGVKIHNTINVLRSREYSGPMSRSLIVSSQKYSNIRQHYVNLGHLSAVYCVLFDKMGEVIVTGADDLLIKLWSARDGRLLATLRGSSGEISDIAIDNRNILLAAGTVDKTIRIWNLQTLAPVSVLVGHQGIITGVNFCPLEVNGFNYLASTSTDGCIGFWKYKLDVDISKTVFHEPVMFNERIRPGNAHILCSSFSPGGLFLATGSGDHNVRVYKMDGQDSPIGILELEEHTDKVDSIQWANHHLRFVSGSRDGTALIWFYKCSQWRFIRLDMNTNMSNVKETTEENNKKLKVTMVAWDKSDRWVLTAINISFQIKIWDAFNGNLIQVLKGHTNEVFVLETHPLDSRVLLSAGHDGLIIIWDILSGKNRGLRWFHNIVDGQGEGALFDGKWSPDGTTCAVTDSYGHLHVYGLGGFKRPHNIPRELFFHTDYRTLNRPNGLFEPTLDEVTNIPPHLMPPAFLVDLNGTPYPPEIQRLVPGRENSDDSQLMPDIITNDEGQVEIVEETERTPERPTEGQRHFNDHGHVYIQTSHVPVFNTSRSRPAEVRPSESHNSPHSVQATEAPKRSFVKRLPLSQYNVVVDKINTFAEIESEEFIRESKKLFDSCATDLPVIIKKEKKRRSRQPKTRLEQVIENLESQFEDPNNLSISGTEESQSESDESQVGASDFGDSSSSSDGTPSSDYSDWIHEGVNLEPPKRMRRYAKVKPAAVTTLPKPNIPDEVPEIYKPSEWLAEIVPKKAPYYPQMGDEVMFFKQGYQKYVDAVRNKGIYELNRLRSSPWGTLILQEPELVKVVGIKYEIAPPRICCLKLGVMRANGKLTNDFFNIKYHDMPDVIDFFVLRQIYETAITREWNIGDRFRSMIDDAWWWGTIEGKPSQNKSPFLGYKILWDNNERENLSPWDLEPLKEGKEPPEPGSSLPVEVEEIQELLYHPRPDEWPQGDRDATCEKIITGLEEVMGLSVAEPFLVPVDISQYPAYAYVVEYPLDLTTLRARFQNRFYRRITSAQFDVRYLAANAEKFNEPHSNIVKYARIIADLLLKIIKEPNPVDVPVVYHELLNGYESSSEEEEQEDKDKSRRSRRLRPTAVTRAQREALHQKQLKRPFNWKNECREILEQLWINIDSEPFRKPVDKLDHPDYDKIVIAPMDLGTIREELRGDNYESPLDFVKDVKRVFHNSRNYNKNKRSKIYIMTTRLADFAEEHLKRITMRWNNMKNRENKKEKKTEKKAKRIKRRRRKIRRTLVESDDELLTKKRRGKGSYENDIDFDPQGKRKTEKSTTNDEGHNSEDDVGRRPRRSVYRSNSNSQQNEDDDDDDDFETYNPVPSTSQEDPLEQPSTSRFSRRSGKRKFPSESVSSNDEFTPHQKEKKLKVMYPKRRTDHSVTSEVSDFSQDQNLESKHELEDDEETDEDYKPGPSQGKRKRQTKAVKSSKSPMKRKTMSNITNVKDPPRSSRRKVNPRNDEEFEYYSGNSLSEENSSSDSNQSADEDWNSSGRKSKRRRVPTRRTNRVGTRIGRHYRENPSDSDYDAGSRYATRRQARDNHVSIRGRRGRGRSVANVGNRTKRRDKDFDKVNRRSRNKKGESDDDDDEEEESEENDSENSNDSENEEENSENDEEEADIPKQRAGRSARAALTRKTYSKSNEVEDEEEESSDEEDEEDKEEESSEEDVEEKTVPTARSQRGRHRRKLQENEVSENSEESSENDNDFETVLPRRTARATHVQKKNPKRSSHKSKRSKREVDESGLMMTCSGDETNDSSGDGASNTGSYHNRRSRRTKNRDQSYAVHSSSTESESDSASVPEVSVSARGRLRKPTAKMRGLE